jgi:3-phosphoshikimate 1-carboxyvinyltransferase
LKLIAQNTPTLNGTVRCPGDKSISQRALIIGSLCNKDISISGFLNGEDPLSTLNALNQIGSDILFEEGIVKISRRDVAFNSPVTPVDLGNSGTGMRLMMGLICGSGMQASLIGDESLMRRPMDRVASPLNQMGANIVTSNGTPPVMINKTDIIEGFSYELPVASAQVKSAILLAGVAANKQVTVIEPSITRDHTELMLQYFGLNIDSKVHESGKKITFIPGNKITAIDYEVVGDFSSASFLIVATLIAKDSEVCIKNVGLNPTRCGLLDVLIDMGANIKIQNKQIMCQEIVGDIVVKSSKLRGINIGGKIIPNIIDEIPILSIAAASADGETNICDAKELRVKESDRLEAISCGLSDLGVEHKLFEDGIRIKGGIPVKQKLIEIDSFGDHRIAMSFLISSLCIKNGVSVNDCSNIYTSYPNFTETMHKLGMRINEE